MLKSMTGFGKASVQYNGKTISVELKSLNGKFLDANTRLPTLYREKEIEIRNLCATLIGRGKVEINVGMENSENNTEHSINKKLAHAYFSELKLLSEELKVSEQDLLALVVRMPEVVQFQKEVLDKKEWEAVLKLVKKAWKELDAFRIREGKIISKDFEDRITAINKICKRIAKMHPEKLKSVRERLETHLMTGLGNGKIDQNRMEQEMIYYLEKLDVNEELVRLESHCSFFSSTLKNKEIEKGKKLGFINQEIGREINTIGSKIQDAEMQKLVVQMKDELEKIKEQTLNIL